MMTEGKHEGDSSIEDDAALWDMLERAPKPGPVSPYFARRVMREVAALEDETPATGWWTKVVLAWRGQGRGVFAGALGAVALLAAGARLTPTQWYSSKLPAVVSDGGTLGRVADEPRTEVDPVNTAVSSPTPQLASVDAGVTAQDVEVIADLDNLLSREESRLWTEDDTARF